MKTKILIPIIAVILGNLVTIASSFNKSLPKYSEAIGACMRRTGLKRGEILRYTTRNHGCTIDCFTKHGEVFSEFAKEKLACYDSAGFLCYLGKCLGPDDYSDYPKDLQDVKIEIKSAYVPDEDDLPTAGSSDSFVAISVENFGKPNFEDGALVCHTYVVQDTSYPRWNFTCQPPPLRSNTILRFDVVDSDKPSNHIDILGTAIESVEYLINRGPTKLDLKVPGMEGASYYLEVDITGGPFEP